MAERRPKTFLGLRSLLVAALLLGAAPFAAAQPNPGDSDEAAPDAPEAPEDGDGEDDEAADGAAEGATEGAPPTTEAAEGEGEAPGADEGKSDDEFVEGELASVGAVGLVPWENRFGIVLGVEKLGEVFYGTVKPEINYKRKLLDQPFSMSFAVPVRIQLLDSRAEYRWDEVGSVRTEDWDEAKDFAQIIRRLRWGGKEKHFYLDINQFGTSTIGHGTILKRYNPNLSFDVHRVSMQLDAFMDYGGVETFVNDITGPTLVGGLVFVKPLSFLDSSSYVMRSFSIGFTMVSDIEAPMRNHLDLHDADQDAERWTELAVDQDDFEILSADMPVVGYGVDLEVKLLDYRALDWKTYFDYSILESGVPTDDPTACEDPRYDSWDDIPTRHVRSGGFTWGHLLRMNLGQDPTHALRIRAEVRAYEPNYLPSYFDVLYELQRRQYFGTKRLRGADLANATKLQQVLGRETGGPLVKGGYFEMSWKVAHYFAFATAFELNDLTADDNLFIHLEVPHLGRWQFAATYHRRAANGFSDLFDWFSSDNDFFLLMTRIGLGDAIHLSAEAITPFDLSGNISTYPVQVNLNLELGFSY